LIFLILLNNQSFIHFRQMEDKQLLLWLVQRCYKFY